MAPLPFREANVEIDGSRIRYMEAGQGTPLVHRHGAGGLRLTRAHDLLARHFRVLAFELPEGPSPAPGLARAIATLSLDTFNLMGTSVAGAALMSTTRRTGRR